MKATVQIIPQKGELYWWNKKILVEFIEHNSKGYVFKTTNCGYMTIKDEQLNKVISKD